MTIHNHPAAIRHPAARRPMRVALFSGNYDCVRDGANQALNRLVAYLLDSGQAQVRVYSPRAPRPAFRSAGEICPVPSLSLPGRPEYRLAVGFTRRTRADFDRFQPDLVHLSAPDILGRQAQNYARRTGIPVVGSLHTRFETYVEYYKMGILRPAIERYLRRFYGDCDHILAPNRPIAEELGRAYGAARVSIWSRGVDRTLFHPGLRCQTFRAAHGFSAEEVVPLFFGRLVKEKGLDVFAETILQLRHNGLPVRPLVVGDGPARSWLADQLPMAAFTGHLEGSALGRAVASADVMINPSITEAFGNVTLEAMASGLAVVAADVPSASALITPGQDGLLVPAAQPMHYANAVEALAGDPALRLSLSTRAARRADQFDWSDVLQSVVREYHRCLGLDERRLAA